MSSPTLHKSKPGAFRIERQPVTGHATANQTVTDHITAIITRQIQNLAGRIEPAALTASREAQTFGGFGTAAALERHISEWRQQRLHIPTKSFDLTLVNGTRIVSPPYDHSWATGAGVPLSQVDGKMLAFGEDGFSASGCNIVLTSPSELLVSAMPVGTYDFSYAALANYPALVSQGGLGILVYANGQEVFTATRIATLWSFSGINQFTGFSGSGNYADAVVVAGSSTTFGENLAPVAFLMNPGVIYELWMWCWVACANMPSGTAFISDVKCNIPLVNLDGGPPPVIH